MVCTIVTDSVVTFVATSNGLLDCTGVVARGVDAWTFDKLSQEESSENSHLSKQCTMHTFLLEGGNRFSFRFGVSADRIGVDVLGDDVADVVAAALDRLGVFKVFGNGGLSFFCLLASPIITNGHFKRHTHKGNQVIITHFQ